MAPAPASGPSATPAAAGRSRRHGNPTPTPAKDTGTRAPSAIVEPARKRPRGRPSKAAKASEVAAAAKASAAAAAKQRLSLFLGEADAEAEVEGEAEAEVVEAEAGAEEAEAGAEEAVAEADEAEAAAEEAEAGAEEAEPEAEEAEAAAEEADVEEEYDMSVLEQQAPGQGKDTVCIKGLWTKEVIYFRDVKGTGGEAIRSGSEHIARSRTFTFAAPLSVNGTSGDWRLLFATKQVDITQDTLDAYLDSDCVDKGLVYVGKRPFYNAGQNVQDLHVPEGYTGMVCDAAVAPAFLSALEAYMTRAATKLDVQLPPFERPADLPTHVTLYMSQHTCILMPPAAEMLWKLRKTMESYIGGQQCDVRALKPRQPKPGVHPNGELTFVWALGLADKVEEVLVLLGFEVRKQVSQRT